MSKPKKHIIALMIVIAFILIAGLIIFFSSEDEIARSGLGLIEGGF